MSTIEAKTEALKKSKAEEFATACPSRVIEMALEDLEAMENDERYYVDMGVWHCPGPAGKCAVCFAGSVMANRLGISPKGSYEPCDFNPATENRLTALNLFRTGMIDDGLHFIGPKLYMADWRMTDYRENPDKFKSQMHAMAAMLRQQGL